MVMNFYKEQEHARKKTYLLLVLFLLVTILLTAMFAGMVKIVLSFYFNQNDKQPEFLWSISLLFPLMVFIASGRKLKQLSNGNYSAKIMGGILLTQAKTLKEQQVRNTV